MNNLTALTIDPAATKDAIQKDGRQVASYARSRGFSETTAAQILKGRYPYTERLDSVFQNFLRALQRDGYLVESGTEHAAA